MKGKPQAALFLIAGVILLLPVTGVAGAGRLTKLYGLPFVEPNLVILMRQRAVPFGLVGGLVSAAAFRQAWQPLALGAGLVNIISFFGAQAGITTHCNAS